MIGMAINLECPYFSIRSPNKADFTITRVILSGESSGNVRFNQ